MIYPLSSQSLGRPQLEFRWEHPTHPTPKLWLKAAFNPKRLQVSQKEGKKETPTKSAESKTYTTWKGSMAIATPWVKNHGPLLLATELGSDAEKPSTDSLRCSSFMAVQVVLGGFPYYIERNSCLIRVAWLRTIQFHVSQKVLVFFNH